MPNESTPTPPFVSFRTFWTFIEELHQQRPLPHFLENSIFGPKRSGSARHELLAALRFFRLVTGDDRRVTQELEDLVESPTTERLRALLQQHYAPILDLDLTRATRSQVDDALRALGAPPSVIPRARSFFINAATEAGIEVGQRVKARSPAAQRRRAGAQRSRGTTGNGDKGGSGQDGQDTANGEPDPDLQKQYLNLLLKKVEQSDSPDTDLLTRIEWLLGYRPAPPEGEPEK